MWEIEIKSKYEQIVISEMRFHSITRWWNLFANKNNLKLLFIKYIVRSFLVFYQNITDSKPVEMTKLTMSCRRRREKGEGGKDFTVDKLSFTRWTWFAGMGVYSSQKFLSFPAENTYLSLVVFPLASSKILIFP